MASRLSRSSIFIASIFVVHLHSIVAVDIDDTQSINYRTAIMDIGRTAAREALARRIAQADHNSAHANNDDPQDRVSPDPNEDPNHFNQVVAVLWLTNNRLRRTQEIYLHSHILRQLNHRFSTLHARRNRNRLLRSLRRMLAEQRHSSSADEHD